MSAHSSAQPQSAAESRALSTTEAEHSGSSLLLPADLRATVDSNECQATMSRNALCMAVSTRGGCKIMPGGHTNPCREAKRQPRERGLLHRQVCSSVVGHIANRLNSMDLPIKGEC